MKNFVKKLYVALVTMALVAMMAVPAMAAGTSDAEQAARGAYTQSTYFYHMVDGVMTAAPHGHDVIKSYDVDEDGNVTLYTGNSTVYGLTGKITAFGANGGSMGTYSDAYPDIEFVKAGTYTPVQLIISYAGHPSDLTDGSWYIRIDN